MSRENVFIFVACGADEHLKRLNFSLKSLKKHSRETITVVTDLSRNNSAIEHDDVLDVRAPKAYDSKQASRFLKTSLHRILPLEGRRFCYLDSDVVALSPCVDEVFAHKKGPVTFAADHCRLQAFSPYALHCGCHEQHLAQSARLHELSDKYFHFPGFHEPETAAKRDELYRLLAEWKAIKNGESGREPESREKIPSHDTVLDFDEFFSTRGFFYDPESGIWSDEAGMMVVIDYERVIAAVEALSEFRFDLKVNVWRDSEGREVFKERCDHLQEGILERFGVTVAERDWQHWNSGVYLFDEQSVPFLDTWHQWTVECLEDPYWRTRDQGTLIAAAWNAGLQHNALLPARFNLIVDYFSESQKFDKQRGFSTDGFQTSIDPCFVHIINHWSDESWDVWQWVVEQA